MALKNSRELLATHTKTMKLSINNQTKHFSNIPYEKAFGFKRSSPLLEKAPKGKISHENFRPSLE